MQVKALGGAKEEGREDEDVDIGDEDDDDEEEGGGGGGSTTPSSRLAVVPSPGQLTRGVSMDTGGDVARIWVGTW